MTCHVENFSFENGNILSVLSVLRVKTKQATQMVNLLNINHFCPAKSSATRSKRECDELSCTVWSLVMVRDQLTSEQWLRIGIHLKIKNFFVLYYFLLLLIYIYIYSNFDIYLLSLSMCINIYIQQKKKATNYCIRFGHSLWSAISCQRKWLMTDILSSARNDR